MKKKLFNIIFLILLTISLLSCEKESYNGVKIITTLYPQYDIARNIVGDKAKVSLLIPLGSEVHDYAPTAKDIVSIKEADLFLYTSAIMEPWTKEIIKNVNYLDLSKSFTLVPYDNNNLNDDIHYWTDPLIILTLVDVIKDEIIKIDQNNKDYYENNASLYKESINIIHNKLLELRNNLNSNPKIFFYGHNAMQSFASRYNIDIISLSDNYKPDADLTPSQIINLKNSIKENNAKYLFVEELINRKGPNSLVDELRNEGFNLEILELHGFHNITKEQDKEGISYANLLEQNYQNIKKTIIN